MISRLNIVLALIGITAITHAGYAYQKHIDISQKLANSAHQCDNRLSDLSTKFDAEITKIQREIAQRKVQPATIETLVSYEYETLPEEFLAETDKPEIERYDESLGDIVARKYRFLFAKLDLSPGQLEQLKLLLEQREALALKIKDAKEFGDDSGIDKDSLWDIESELENVNTQIEELLDDETRQRFTALKDSDEEQKHFNQYTLGVNSLFPLDNVQQEAVLFTRLKHKQQFEEKLQSSGFDQDYPLSKEQSEKLLKDLEMAAMRYKHSFLQEIRRELDHSSYPMDQYTLLENYTNTEFKELLSAYREKIEQRGVY